MPGMLLKKSLLVVCLLFLFVCADAQNNIVFQHEEDVEMKISYTPAPDQNQKITNFFIQEIARSLPKKTEFTQYIFGCTKIDRIAATGTAAYSATFEILNAGCSGDIVYKGFSVADVLIPTHCSFTFNVFSDKAIPVYKKTVTEAPLNIGYNLLDSYKFSDTSASRKYSTRIDDFSFHYSDYSISRFNSKIKLIDEYFASEATIDQCLKKIREIDYNNTDMIIVYDISLKEVEKISEEIYNKEFPGKLNLVNYDPVGFIDKYNELAEVVFQTRHLLNQKLANLDKLYYEKGLAQLKSGDKEKAKTYFNRSILYNPDFVPSQLELVKIYFYDDSLNMAADKISYILNSLNPAPDIYKQVLLYTDSVYSALLTTGNELNRLQKYNEAIDVLEKCVVFCDSIPGYTCDDKHVKGLASARFGIYQSYLSVAQKAIDNGKYELAEIYISDARNYQKTYKNFIINDAEALSKLEKIMLAFVAKGDTLIARMQYEKGLMNLEKAKNISEVNRIQLPATYDKSMKIAQAGIYSSMLSKCARQVALKQTEAAEKALNEAIAHQRKYSDMVTPAKAVDTLLKRIRQYQYDDLINNGRLALTAGNFFTALQHFDLAQKLAKEYFLKSDIQMDSLLMVSARPVIDKQLLLTEKLLSADKPDSARTLADNAATGIAAYGLSKDTAVTDKLRLLKKNIFELQCRQAKNRFENLMTRANMAVAHQDFITADSLYVSAGMVADSFPQCAIDISTAIEGKKEYLLPCNYQKMLLKAGKALVLSDNNSFFYYYLEAENFYKNMHLSSFGLIHPSLTDKIALSSDTAFVFAATEFMIQKNRPEDALLCLKTLKKLHYPLLAAKNLQLQVGAVMARKDFEVNKALQPNIIVVSYTGKDSWLSFFKSSYTRTWKSLKKISD